jgi:hypothetical protein
LSPDFSGIAFAAETHPTGGPLPDSYGMEVIDRPFAYSAAFQIETGAEKCTKLET